MSDFTRKMMLTVTGFLFVLTSLAVIAVPSMVLAESVGNQDKEASGNPGAMTFLSTDMPPFGTMQDGKLVGFTVEILHEIMQRLGRTDTIVLDDWKVVYERTLTEPYTALWPPSRTPEREELFKWVGPLIPEKIVLFARKDSGLVINSLDDAKKVSGVATVTGYASENLLKQNGFDNLVSQRSPIQGSDALKFGRADLWINSNVTMRQTALDADVDPDLFEAVFVVKEVPSYLAFSKSVPDEVVNQWQTALDAMKREGSWGRIVSKWVPNEFKAIGSDKINLTLEEERFLKNHPVLKVAYDVDWPPVEFFDKERGMNGMAADYLKGMSELLGVKFEPGKPRSWKEMMRAVEEGELDFFTAVAPTPQRRKWMDFTESYLSFPIVILTDKEVPYISSMADLKNKPVAVVDGYASHDLLLENHPDLTLMPVQDVKKGLMAVSTGKAFAFVGSLATASHVISREGLTDLKVSGDTTYHLGITMGARKDNAVLLKILDKALASISLQEKNAINSRWTSVTYEHSINYALIWQIIAVALVIVAIILYWNDRLKKEVAERKSAEKALERLNNERKEMIQILCHDLTNPFNMITTSMEIVEQGLAGTEEFQEDILSATESGMEIIQLVRNMHALEANKLDLEMINLEEAVAQSTLLLKERFSVKGVELVVNVDSAMVVLVERTSFINSVLNNIFSNAVKFSHRGSKIVVNADVNGDYATITIRDFGVGMSERLLGDLFDLNKKTSRPGTEKESGTGFGMPLIKKFITAYGGTIEIESKETNESSDDHGTKVSLCLKMEEV